MDKEEGEVPIFPIPDVDTDSLRIRPGGDVAKNKEQTKSEQRSGRQAVSADVLEEIAEDLEVMIRGMGRLERQMQETSSAVAELKGIVAEHSSYQYRLVESLRGDLAGDRRGLAVRSMFEPAAVALDQLEAVGKGFDPCKDQMLYGQVSAAAATLSNLLQSLGFTRFVPDLGEAFDPKRMQCLGYAQGEPGVVLQVLRPGYMTGETLVRPSGVLIANPEQEPGVVPARNESGG